MSSTGQIVGGVVGAVVGYVATGFNPVGAYQGFAIGAAVGGYLDPPKGPTAEGPRLTDKTVQTSTYGATIPRVYGTVKVAGNVFWLENNQLKEVVRKESSGGKGGGSTTEVKTYTYYATFAVGLCKGPIAGVRRIWIGPYLIYDAESEDVNTIIAGNQNIQGIEIYLGTEDQLPNTRMQADRGVANVPAYRGLAYIVIKDLEMTKYGNSIAQAQVNVELVKNAQVNEIVEINRIPIPDGAIYHGGNSALITDEGYGYIATGASNPKIYRVTSSGFQLADDLSTGGWTLESGPFAGQEVNVTSNNAAYMAYNVSGTSIRINGQNYSVPVGSASKIAITPNGTIYGCSLSAVGFSISEISLSGAVEIYSEDLLPSFQRQVSSLIADGENLFVISAGPSLDTYIHKFDLGTNQATLVDTVNLNLTNAISANCTFDSEYIYASTDVASGEIVRIVKISKDTLAKISTDTYPVELSNAADAGFTKYCLTNSGLITTIGENDELITYKINAFETLRPDLASIVRAETLLSNIVDNGEVITTGLTDSVYGYLVASAGSIRNGIEPLRGAWPFDAIQDGYNIRYRPRGTSSVATIDIGELGVDQQIQESREMDSQIPRKVIIKHIDRDRDYDANEQSDQRENVDSINTLTLDLPVVLTPTESKRVAQKLLYLYWLERSDFSFVLPPTYQYLQPSDVVTIDAGYATYEIRISTIKYVSDGRLECVGKPNNASVYNSIADTDGGQTPPATVPLPGPSQEILIDAPIIDETLQNEPGFTAFMSGITSSWPGGNLFVTNDNGQTWQTLQAFVGAGTFGLVSGTLSANAGTQIQKGGTITVALLAGSLESITEDQMKNGRNYAAYGLDGRWEIIRFQNATLNADGTYTLDTFIRGDRGTEWATGLHQSSDVFVLMDDQDGAWMSQASASIGVERGYRAVTAGFNIDSDVTENFTYRGVNLETYSPAHGKGARDGSSNLTISWTRRTRVGGEWRSLVDASLGETTESYEVDVMNGSTVVRTLTSTTQSVVYSAANQTTDFGSPQASVTVRIYQLSSVVGRGQPLEVTV